jgi:hypothetical protein
VIPARAGHNALKLRQRAIPDRAGIHPARPIADHCWIVHADAMAGSTRSTGRIENADCSAQARRKLFELGDIAKARKATFVMHGVKRVL